jgi:hypothetical protein
VVIVCVHLLTLSSRNAETNRLLKTHPLAEPEEEPTHTPSSDAPVAEAVESKDDNESAPPLNSLPATSPHSPLPLLSSATPSTPLPLPPPVREDGDLDQDTASGIIWESSDDEDEDDDGDVYLSSDESEPSSRHETRPASFWEEEEEEDAGAEESSDSLELSYLSSFC